MTPLAPRALMDICALKKLSFILSNWLVLAVLIVLVEHKLCVLPVLMELRRGLSVKLMGVRPAHLVTTVSQAQFISS